MSFISALVFFNSQHARVRDLAEDDVHAPGGGGLVVLHPHHDLLLHSQHGRLPHHRAHGEPDRERGGPVQSERNQVRHPAVRQHARILLGE